jgi:hypothetical protein
MKNYIVLILSLFAFSFLYVTPTKAIDNTKEGLSYVCLNVVKCSKDGPCSVEDVHRGRLTPGDKRAVESSKKSYVTECLDVDSDGNGVTESICTTGNSALDMELLDEDNFTRLKNATHGSERKPILYNLDGSRGEKVDNSKNPYGVYYMEGDRLIEKDPPVTVQTDSSGRMVPNVMEWQSYTDMTLTRRFLIYTIVTQEPSINTAVGGQQQDDLGTAYIQSTCEGKAWDPHGRVFDAMSLEPIPAASILLKMYNPTSKPPAFEEQRANTINPNIKNPDITQRDGGFEFIVQDGTYSLTASMTGYTFPSQSALASLSPNATRIYTNLYALDSPGIVQAGVIQQRDIPLIPTDGVGKRYPILVEPNQVVLQNGQQVFSGKVSHPYALLKVSQCPTASTAKECGTPKVYTASEGGPGRDGVFRIQLDQTKLPADYKYTINIESNPDLANAKLTFVQKIQKVIGSVMSLMIPSVHAQSKGTGVTFDIQPIPTYIEGYAYDAKGMILPNAIVGIYVPFSKRPAYQTQANANGYFKITSEFLPDNEYSIKYRVDAAGEPQTSLTTSQFMAQNKEFIESEKVNPYLYSTASTDPRRTVTPAFVPKGTTSVIPKVSVSPGKPSVKPSAVPNQTMTQNPLFLIGAILLLLIATAGTLLAVYLYRKRTQGQSDMSP